MAIDTRNKRASLLGLALALRLVPPAPDAALDIGDRAHLAYLYSGLSVAAAVSLDHACVRRLASDTPIRTLHARTGPRTVARLTPVRSLACLED